MTAQSVDVDEPAKRRRRRELRALVAGIARAAVAERPAGGDPVANVAALIVLDPRNTDHVEAVATVIVRDALGDPGYETTANRWRALVPTWVRPNVVGATVQRMVAAGFLVPTGRYVRCTDTAGKNRGKPQPVYRLDLSAVDVEPVERSAPLDGP